MNISISARKTLTFLVILLFGLLLGSCGNSSPAQAPLPVKPSTPPVSDKLSEEPSPIPQPSAPPSVPINRVDIVYFHPKVRCGACISVELRTKALLNDSFKDAMDSGKLTFQAYELQDKQNASIVKKYGAASSQLFVTTVKGGTETIKHIEEVWMPNILNDGVAFDEFLRKLISQSLKEVG